MGTPGPIKCKGKVPKLINKDLLSNSRERGPLPVGPHPRLFLHRTPTFGRTVNHSAPRGPRGQDRDGSASKDKLGRVSLWGLDR